MKLTWDWHRTHDRARGEYWSKLLSLAPSGLNLARREVYLVDACRVSSGPVILRRAHKVDQSNSLRSNEQRGSGPGEPRPVAARTGPQRGNECELNAASPRILIIEPEHRVFVEKLKHYDFEVIATTFPRKEEEKLRDAFGRDSLKDRRSANARKRG